MNIKNKLYISAIISVIVVVIIFSLVLVSSDRIARERKQLELADDVHLAVSELDIVTYEYLLHREKRMEQQWNSRYDSMGEILEKAEEVGEVEMMKSIRADYAALSDLFSQVTANYEERQKLIQEGASQEKIDANILLEERLVALLLIKLQAISTDASRLAEEAHAETREAQELSNSLTLTLMIILAVTITTTSLVVARRISKPLDELTKGAEIIGKGNLGHLIESKTKDEVGELATAFNRMTTNLKEITASRDELNKEVAERKQTEVALRELTVELEERVKKRTAELTKANEELKQEITERKRTEEKLRLFSQAADSSPDGVAMGNFEGRITYVNETFVRMFGYSKEELIGKEIASIYSKDQIPKLEEALKATMEGGWTGELVGKRKNGELFPMAISSTVVMDEEGSVIAHMASHRDITERKHAEEHIEHLNSVLKAIRDVNQVIIVEKDRDSLLQKAGDALTEARGYDAAWLGFLRDGETFATVKCSGFREDVSRFREHLVGGDYPPCIKNALVQKEKLVVVDKSRECGDCFFKSACAGNEAAIIHVEHANILFGLLTISFAPGVTVDEEEKELLKEVSGDIAFALHDMEVEEARKHAEEALKHTALSLQEHVEKLEESKKKIAEAYRLREHFLKETSHRIITPVAIIGGNTDLLLARGNLDDDQKEKIRIIRERNEEVQKLVRDALAGKYLEDEEEEG